MYFSTEGTVISSVVCTVMALTNCLQSNKDITVFHGVLAAYVESKLAQKLHLQVDYQ